MTPEEEAALALAEVVELGDQSVRATELGAAVSQSISERSAASPTVDPEMAAGLRALARGEPCPLCGRSAP